MKRKFAAFISLIGNPLILAVGVALYVNFTFYPLQEAIKLTSILGFGAVIPIFFYINYQVKKGTFEDHDVSDRRKRKNLYVVALMVLLGMILILHLTHQPKRILAGAYAAWLLGAISYGINFFIKTSLHTGYAFLIGFLSLSVGFWIGISLIGFAFLVGWSRVVLSRHTLQEVFMGAALGTVVGTMFYKFML